jgi:hypothetical protein
MLASGALSLPISTQGDRRAPSEPCEEGRLPPQRPLAQVQALILMLVVLLVQLMLALVLVLVPCETQ